jgi:hypothetical protein
MANEEAEMDIFIRQSGKPDICVRVPSTTTIDQIKQEVQKERDIPTNKQRIIFAGREMKGKATLKEHGIQEDCVLLLFVRAPKRKADEEHTVESKRVKTETALSMEEFLRNPVQRFLPGDDVEQRFVVWNRITGQIKEKFAQYRQGSILFSNVNNAMQRLFCQTLLRESDGMVEWRKKIVILDALVHVFVSETWRRDEDDASLLVAEKQFRKIALGLGSRYISILAFRSKVGAVGQIHEEYETAIHDRLRALGEQATESGMFESGFQVVIDLSSPRSTAEEKRRFMAACSNLHRSIFRRALHFVKLSANDATRLWKYKYVQFKDSLLLPYLEKLPDEPGVANRALFFDNVAKFSYEPTVETWNLAFAESRHLSTERSEKKKYARDALEFVTRSMAATYTFSTRQRKRFTRFADLTLVLVHAAANPYVTEGNEQAIQTALEGLQTLTKMKRTRTIAPVFEAFKDNFLSAADKVNPEQRTLLLQASEELFGSREV